MGRIEKVDEDSILQLKSTGTEVMKIENILIALGYNASNLVKSDEVFDIDTLCAVKDFQSDNGLIENGIVKKDTIKILNRQYEELFNQKKDIQYEIAYEKLLGK